MLSFSFELKINIEINVMFIIDKKSFNFKAILKFLWKINIFSSLSRQEIELIEFPDSYREVIGLISH